ncbi:reverse transcriptase [Tanacetum coccineum]|uniref:Reverse transcriptase n=1 Tax=Tanacetum coccineum TaxID=301880 RepID=A0ABQ5GQY1_9ASTR
MTLIRSDWCPCTCLIRNLISTSSFVKRFGENLTWEEYVGEIKLRFDSVFEDLMVELKSLRQTTSVHVYQDLFIGGLKDEIVVSKSRHAPLLYALKTSFVNTNVNKNGSNWGKNTPLAQNASTVPNRPFKRLTQQELEKKRAKHLCFYCDQKYMPRHKCSGQVFSLEVIGTDMEEDGDLLFSKEGVVNTFHSLVDEQPLISLNALSGMNAYRTMRVKGCVVKNVVHVLIDSGSTHNFLDLQVAKKLGCRLRKICPLDVSMANGNVVTSLYECCDVVLGIQWLATLGSIQWNFKTLIMEFTYQNKKVILRGTQQTTIHWMQGKQKGGMGKNVAKLSAMSAPVLALLDFQKTFVVETDASWKGIRVVLQQDGHPIAYLSKTLSPKHQVLSTYENEFLAVLMAFDKWKGCLLDRHFKIKTDHFSLKYLLGQSYKKRSENIVADAFSRVSRGTELNSLILTSIASDLLQQTKTYVGDKFTWVDGILRRKYKIVVGNVVQLRNNIINHYHSDATRSHSGTTITVHRLKNMVAYLGYLQLLPIPNKIWSSISMDFIEGLPFSHNKTVIMVVVDRLSKCMTSEKPMEWVQWLSLVEFWYNTNFHTAIQTTPFEVVYGQKPPVHVPYMSAESVVETVDRTLQARKQALSLIKFHLGRAQDRMRSLANKHRIDRVFDVGMWVYLKLQPHRQVTIRQGQQNKLSSKYYGPFSIIEKVGVVAYKLDLPDNSQVRLVFHVSQLKLCKGSTNKMGMLPHCGPNGLLPAEPLAILDRRIKKVNNKVAVYVLVK